MVYAGFWRRFAAVFVDGVLLAPVYIVVHARLRGPLLADNATLSYVHGWNLVLIAVYWLYFAGLESSPRQATLGKRLLGIVVADARGERLSFARATGRHFGKLVSALTLGLGYLAAAFTARKQALHDLLAGALVVERDSIALEPPRGTVRVTSLAVFAAVTLVLTGLGYATRNQGRLPRAEVYLVALGHFPRPEVERIAAAYRRRGIDAVTLPTIPLHDRDVDGSRRQLVAESVQNELLQAYGDGVSPGAALVGVTGYDVYSANRPQWDFVFSALDERGTAVISVVRMKDPSSDVVRGRLDKTVARSVAALLRGRLADGDVQSTDELDRMSDPLTGNLSEAETR